MSPMLRSTAIAAWMICTTSTAALAVTAAPHTTIAHAKTIRHVSARNPVQGRSIEFAAQRAVVPSHAQGFTVSAKANKWKLLATIPGAVIHDISFPTAKIGFAAAELGQVWKTVDGGSTWTEIMNLGFPYYWYGVKALSANDVVISGFNDSSTEGIIRWSHDGGSTWTQDIVLTTTGWSYRVRFANKHGGDGLIIDGLSTTSPNAAHYTTDGGGASGDWTEVVPDPNGGWFGNEFSLLSNLHARTSGITYCSSINGGQVWACGPSIDSVFDGPVFFADDTYGWVGGGEISPSVAGWVHSTADGGTTWSERTLQSPFPIREIRFVTDSAGWAAGGNIYSDIGGIYFSSDGGQTWKADLDTSGHEMDACDSRPRGTSYRVWCAGYDSSLSAAIYTLLYKG